MYNLDELKKKVIDICKERCGPNGLRGLRVLFRHMDKDKSGALDPVEFKNGMKHFGLKMVY